MRIVNHWNELPQPNPVSLNRFRRPNRNRGRPCDGFYRICVERECLWCQLLSKRYDRFHDRRDVMSDQIPRRTFLKTAPLAAGILANAAPYSSPTKASEVPISGKPYDPVGDYPLR